MRKVIRDVGRVKATTLYAKDQAYLLRTELKGSAHKAFRTVRLQVPSQVDGRPNDKAKDPFEETGDIRKIR